ncbi:MAG: serine--tRNA ligase, partial [Campylobacterales bacterium]|nr:serine--tRNA ligase [Campylobacterales bacterium]
MIDIKALQKDYETITNKLSQRGLNEELLKDLKDISFELKTKRLSLETAQEAQNKMSAEFGLMMRNKQDVTELKQKVDANKQLIASLNDEVREVEERLQNLATNIPNIPDESVPFGKDESENVELKRVLEPKKFGFKPKEHWELAELNGWIDFERGVKLTKSRFSVLKGMGAKLERALINYMIDFNSQRGFEEMWLPVLANSKVLFGTGQLPKFQDDLFKIEDEDLYLIPTSEVSLTNLYNDEIIDESVLPIKMTAFTPCFRKEAGSGGKDVRGIIRQHQFD